MHPWGITPDMMVDLPADQARGAPRHAVLGLEAAGRRTSHGSLGQSAGAAAVGG